MLLRVLDNKCAQQSQLEARIQYSLCVLWVLCDRAGQKVALARVQSTPAISSDHGSAPPPSCDETRGLPTSHSSSELISRQDAASSASGSRRSCADQAEVASGSTSSATASELSYHRHHHSGSNALNGLRRQAGAIGTGPAKHGNAIRLLQPPQQQAVRLHKQDPAHEHSSAPASTCASLESCSKVAAVGAGRLLLPLQETSSFGPHNRLASSGTAHCTSRWQRCQRPAWPITLVSEHCAAG